ncbi:MAG: hypothetical protein HC884_06510 [Chloroflexaceae bacterium]|nr:hypothetical protein [Chloroflexaceae bacterium]
MATESGGKHAPLQKLVEQCRQERVRFLSTQNPESPSCMDIFRRAFDGDQDAWTELATIFDPNVRFWVSFCQPLGKDEVDIAVNWAWADFWSGFRSLPELLRADNLARVLKYLQTCAKRARGQMIRREQRHSRNIPLDLARLPPRPDSTDPAERLLSVAVRERLGELLTDLREQLVCQWVLGQQIKPHELRSMFPEHFQEVQEIYAIRHNLIKRLRRDATLQDLAASAQNGASEESLMMSVLNPDEDRNQTDMSCEFPTDLLLDYLGGFANAEVCAAIEQSPACMDQVRQLERETEALLTILYRAHCPTSEQLIAYQQKQLPSAEALVLYRHLTHCPLCQEEVHAFELMDAAFEEDRRSGFTRHPLTPLFSGVRSLIEAIFRSAHEMQVLGSNTQCYHTPQVLITLYTEQPPGQMRTWELWGEVRTIDGVLATDLLQEVLVQQLDEPVPTRYQGHIEASGAFVFEDLPTGTYRLSLLTSDEEITIRHIVIGDEQ